MDGHGCRLPLALFGVLAFTVPCLTGPAGASAQSLGFEPRSLDGGGNNVARPTLGQRRHAVPRESRPPPYGDGSSTMRSGPNARLDQQPDLQRRRPERLLRARVTQWAWTWGQFLDHTFGLATDRAETRPPSPSTPTIRSRRSRNDLGVDRRSRATPAAAGHRRRARPRSRSTRVSSLHRRLGRVRRHPAAPGVAARGAGRRRPGQQRRHAAAAATATCRARDRPRRCRDRAGDGSRRAR